MLPVQWHSASLVCAGSGTSDCGTCDRKIILRSDNEPAILDLKRQATAECRVRHGMTVIIDDTTECESQDTGWLRWRSEKSRVWRASVRVALSEQQRYQFEAPGVILARLLCCRTDHTRTDWSRWVDTAPKTERESVPKAASCLCRVRPPHVPFGKRAGRLPERWSDGLFLGVVERSSEFCVCAVCLVSCELEV